MAMGIDQNPHLRHGKYVPSRRRTNFKPLIILVTGIAIGYFGRDCLHHPISYLEEQRSNILQNLDQEIDKPKTIDNILTAEALQKDMTAPEKETTITSQIIPIKKDTTAQIQKDSVRTYDAPKTENIERHAPFIEYSMTFLNLPDTAKKMKDTLKTETKKEEKHPPTISTDYRKMFSDFTDKGKKPAVYDNEAINKTMMDNTEQKFYRYLVEGISRSLKDSNCDSVKMYCDAIKEAFPEAHKTNRRIAMDANAPNRERSWAYTPMKNCRMKFEW